MLEILLKNRNIFRFFLHLDLEVEDKNQNLILRDLVEEGGEEEV